MAREEGETNRQSAENVAWRSLFHTGSSITHHLATTDCQLERGAVPMLAQESTHTLLVGFYRPSRCWQAFTLPQPCVLGDSHSREPGHWLSPSGTFALVGCVKISMDLSTSGYETTNFSQSVGGLRWQQERLCPCCIPCWAHFVTSNCCGAGDLL